MRELLGGTEEKSLSPKRGLVWICLEGKSMIFLKKETEKNELVAIPDIHATLHDRVEDGFVDGRIVFCEAFRKE